MYIFCQVVVIVNMLCVVVETLYVVNRGAYLLRFVKSILRLAGLCVYKRAMNKMEENLISYGLSRKEGPPPDDEAFAETRLTKKFRRGLMRMYGMTEGDLQDWQYCGGDYNKDQPWHAKFKENFKLNCEWQPDKDKCVCGVDIYYNCYITNRNRDFVITTGRCCIDKFLGPNRRRCEICHETIGVEKITCARSALKHHVALTVNNRSIGMSHSEKNSYARSVRESETLKRIKQQDMSMSKHF